MDWTFYVISRNMAEIWNIFFNKISLKEGSQQKFPVDIYTKIAVVDSPLGVYVDNNYHQPNHVF